MLVTGLRLRFFLISLGFLFITTLSLTSLLAYYYRSERLSFLDDQIRETATSIVDSRLSDLKAIDYSVANGIITDELGPERVGKFFIIRDNDGRVLFETDNIRLLDLTIPQSPKWISVHDEGRLIRAVNLSLPRVPNRTLQVGIITDSSFIFWTTLNTRTLALIGALMGVLLIITWFLSATLFAPVKRVGHYLKEAQQALIFGKDVPPLSNELQKFLDHNAVAHYDEFSELLAGVQQLGSRINLNTKFTRSWTFQMAHELKTPLTILNRDLEELAKKHSFSKQEVDDTTFSLNRVSQTITNFLNWADLATTGVRGDLHVIRTSTLIEELKGGWNKIGPARVQIFPLQDFQVLGNPFHLAQLLDNLVVNAIKYAEGEIEVTLQDNNVTIEDFGAGIPKDVLERIGSPFNKGPQTGKTGSGLGLAWIKTICDLYSWNLNIESSHKGTKVKITFPNLSATTES